MDYSVRGSRAGTGGQSYRMSMRLGMARLAGCVLLAWAACQVPAVAAPSDPDVAPATNGVRWTGPVQGPRAVANRSVVFVAPGMSNSAILELSEGVQEAARAIGWQLKILDGGGSVQGRGRAFRQALDLKPDAIIIGGFDGTEQQPYVAEAARRRIPLIGWHASDKPGPSAELFYNITSDPLEVARVAAQQVVAQAAKGPVGVVVLTDGDYAVARAKSDLMAQLIRSCRNCTLLALENVSIPHIADVLPDLTRSWLSQYGKRWTHTLAINDVYFDFMGTPLAIAGRTDIRNISAGDGATTAFQRIRTQRFQSATVPEPIQMHGWQAIDEVNRALSGQPPSGFVSPVHLVTPANVELHGGSANRYDPSSDYRKAYRALWGR